MTTRYAILYVGAEYNDEGYNVGGDDARVLGKTYATKEEAKEALAGELQKILEDFDLTDFSNYTYGSGIENYLKEFHGSAWAYGVSWKEYIKYKNEIGEKWTDDAPELLKISEIEV